MREVAPHLASHIKSEIVLVGVEIGDPAKMPCAAPGRSRGLRIVFARPTSEQEQHRRIAVERENVTKTVIRLSLSGSRRK